MRKLILIALLAAATAFAQTGGGLKQGGAQGKAAPSATAWSNCSSRLCWRANCQAHSSMATPRSSVSTRPLIQF